MEIDSIFRKLNFKSTNFRETENKVWLPGAKERANWEQSEKVWRWKLVMVTQQRECMSQLVCSVRIYAEVKRIEEETTTDEKLQK